MRLLAFTSVVFLAVVTGCASVSGRYDDGEHLAKTTERSETVFLSGTYVNWSSEERRYLYLQINSDGTGMYASSSPRDPFATHFGGSSFALPVTWSRTGPASYEAITTELHHLAVLRIRIARVEKSRGDNRRSTVEVIIVEEVYADGSGETMLTRQDLVDEAVEGIRTALSEVLRIRREREHSESTN